MIYLGDFAAGATVYATFNTVNAVGLPTAFDASAVVKLYKNGATAESVAGVTLTQDFDGRNGLHHVAIDLSADAVFYAAGGDFFAVITSGSVDGVSLVGTKIAQFSVENRWALDAAAVRAAIGLASANLDTQLDALPTNAELASALAAADDATLAAIAALSIPTVSAIAAGILSEAASTPIAANAKQVNDVDLTGNGTVSTPWGPA